MPTRDVYQGFEEFHKRLVTSTTETEAAKNHRASIQACLKSNFGLLRFFRSGSFGNATNIRNHSDVDYFAWLPNENMKTNSSTTLAEVSSALRLRFPRTYGIRVDSPAVVVPFGSDASETTEVIPAGLADGSEPYVYRIANGYGGWMLSSPGAQNDYVRTVDASVEGKAKPLIRFLKAWKYYRDVPISSFYLELVAAKYAAGESIIIYSWDLRSVFETLWKSDLAAVDDPAGKSGKVVACRTDPQKKNALDKVLSAFTSSTVARVREESGDISGAFYYWNLLYNGQFPSHIY